MRRWAAALLLALLSVGGGLAAKARPSDTAAGGVVSWLAARGFMLHATSRALGGAEGHRLLVLERPDGCAVGVVPFDSPEEILPLLRQELPAAAWQAASLWLGDLRPHVPGPARLQSERIWIRLRHGTAPRPALVLPGPGCGSGL